MSQAMSNPMLMEDFAHAIGDTWADRVWDWVRTELIWYAASFTFHLLGLSALLLLGNVAARTIGPPPDAFVSVAPEPEPEAADIQPLHIPPVVDDDLPPPIEANYEPIKAIGPESELMTGGDGGGGTETITPDIHAGFGPGEAGRFSPSFSGPGPMAGRPGGMAKSGTGPGGGGGPFGPRRRGHGFYPFSCGPIPQSEAAVRHAIGWLARHQSSDGSWSLKNYVQRCKDASCSGPGNVDADAAATAMGLLPFLAAGETHKTGGKTHYRAVAAGLLWLMRHQKPDGDLSAGSPQQMYAHALATIALCEAYGMTYDKNVGMAAQAAVGFIETAQNRQTGGWRYHPGEEGDTSVVGWQVMALKSAEMAGLNVGGASLDWAGKFLGFRRQGLPRRAVRLSARPGADAGDDRRRPALPAISGAKRGDPLMVEGSEYFLAHLPERSFRNLYYWYYATQVMHNVNDQQWDVWNRKMRRLLVETQNVNTSSCAFGSWDPDGPAKDQWGGQGGRLMMTSLSALTLEVYYRYLPLYKIEEEKGEPARACRIGGHGGDSRPAQALCTPPRHPLASPAPSVVS